MRISVFVAGSNISRFPRVRQATLFFAYMNLTLPQTPPSSTAMTCVCGVQPENELIGLRDRSSAHLNAAKHSHQEQFEAEATSINENLWVSTSWASLAGSRAE
jgi:hypothetical protein